MVWKLCGGLVVAGGPSTCNTRCSVALYSISLLFAAILRNFPFASFVSGIRVVGVEVLGVRLIRELFSFNRFDVLSVSWYCN